MGRVKYANEELIRYGWPEDLWFHVDKMSSAHVYLRFPKDLSFDDIDPNMVEECAQLTKLNSIEGCKTNNVPVVYTPWSNLRKSGDMATGQVGFHKNALVKKVVVEKRINEICNRLNKTKVEKHNNPAELFELRQERDAEELGENQTAARRVRQDKSIKEAEARAFKAREQETIYGMVTLDEEQQAAAADEQMQRITASLAQTSTDESRGGCVARPNLVSRAAAALHRGTPSYQVRRHGRGGRHVRRRRRREAREV
jgi:hypothetical protein